MRPFFIYNLLLQKSTLEKLNLPVLNQHNVTVYIKRDDLIHREISGNKWRKIKYNLLFAAQNKFEGILTFGGAHSNHILAVAYVCKENNLKCLGIIRGDEHVTRSKTLTECETLGMEFTFMNRTDYREKSDDKYLKLLQEQYPNYLIIPEGGANDLGVKGCEEIISEIDIDFDFISVDCGTGATLAGMIRKLKPNQKAIGVQVLKGQDFITEEVIKFSPNLNDKFEIWTDYHFGGYAKYHNELIEFMRWFYQETRIKLDPIYTGKQFYGVFDQIKKGYFPKGATIVLTHTGGLQGIEGFEERYGMQIYT